MLNQKINIINRKQLSFKMFFYCFFLIFAVFNYINNNGIFIYLIICFVLFICTNFDEALLLFCFTLPLSDGLTVFNSMLSYCAIMDVIFLIKLIYNHFKKCNSFNTVHISMILLLILGQFLTVIIWKNSIINVLKYSVNMLIFYYLYVDYKYISRKNLIPNMFMFSVFSGAVISISMKTNIINGLRFSGIWNDENFAGMYSIIGVVSAIFFLKKNIIKRIWIAFPVILIIIFTATLSLSRSFVYIIVILSIVSFFLLLYTKNVNVFYKVILICIFVVIFYLLFSLSLKYIINMRGLASSGSDWTNSRIEYTKNGLYSFFEEPIAWFTGVGVDNVPNFSDSHGYQPRATHNTYVDFIVQFGIFQGILIIIIIKKYFLRSIINKNSNSFEIWIIFVIILYMITLTLTQYEILYFSLGCFMSLYSNNKRI